ncbi:hypothetical protein W97_08436 [Coniosporium apollinis CBS 100218]|uniref:Uncharacterized protein n=1 Tax=Coniosporium apollinis (strain CBS 100218) TaxID=1168221 RepID=R7Z5S8_CONA1|nr:uncharacterized protein W97_08436 [Coniosporium apollinis CBS 100218]EON69276.1 hypothetical protein W97_08436 [Coniosporium apollinis CBS 100218]
MDFPNVASVAVSPSGSDHQVQSDAPLCAPVQTASAPAQTSPAPFFIQKFDYTRNPSARPSYDPPEMPPAYEPPSSGESEKRTTPHDADIEASAGVGAQTAHDAKIPKQEEASGVSRQMLPWFGFLLIVALCVGLFVVPWVVPAGEGDGGAGAGAESGSGG